MARRRGDGPARFDAEDAREVQARRVALAGEHFGPVEPEGADPDEDFARFGGRDGPGFELEDGGVAGGVHDDGFHAGHFEEGVG